MKKKLLSQIMLCCGIYAAAQHSTIDPSDIVCPARRGYSSAGRALEWHSRGHRFEPDYLHHKKSLENAEFSSILKAFLIFKAKLIKCINQHKMTYKCVKSDVKKMSKVCQKNTTKNRPIQIGEGGFFFIS